MSGPATIGGTVASAKPANQVCPICGYDDDVETILADDEWVMTCESHNHPPFEWRPKEQYRKPLSGGRTGIGEELGVYADLLDCVDDGFAEFGIVEYRFWERAPKTYTILVERYGHTVYGPSKYTTSKFLGGALGQLWRERLVDGVWAPATGYWSYNRVVGAYARMGTPHDTPITSWQDFALGTLGVDPLDWPPLGHTH
jgi:hypothetical protein